MNIFAEIVNNKLLLYSAIAVIFFIAISIILIKKVNDEKEDDDIVDIKKIDGKNSVFDELIEETEKNNSNQLDLDSMIAKMQQDLDAKASEVVEKFETEQEEKSVISYQELMENKKEESVQSIVNDEVEEPIQSIAIDEVAPTDILNSNINQIEYQELNGYQEDTDLLLEKLDNVENMANETINEQVSEKNEPVSRLNMKDEFVEAIKTGNYIEQQDEVTPKENEIIEKEPSKFKATEFISPIYGIQDIKMQYPTIQNMRDFKEKMNRYNKVELDDALDIQNVSREVHQDEDFLNSLKEFRKNLQ